MSSISLEPFQNLDKRQARSRIQMLPRKSQGTATVQTKAVAATTDKILETEGAKTTATNLARIGMAETVLATVTNHAIIAPVRINDCSSNRGVDSATSKVTHWTTYCDAEHARFGHRGCSTNPNVKGVQLGVGFNHCSRLGVSLHVSTVW